MTSQGPTVSITPASYNSIRIDLLITASSFRKHSYKIIHWLILEDNMLLIKIEAIPMKKNVMKNDKSLGEDCNGNGLTLSMYDS